MRTWLALFLALPILAACAALEPADCRSADRATYVTALDRQLATFQQQAELVGASPRMSIGVPLQRLLDIQTETRDLAAPGCLTAFHERVTEAMATQQQGFQAFAAQQGSDGAAVAQLQLGQVQLMALRAELEQMQGGALLPTPEPVIPPEPGVVDQGTVLRFVPGPDAKGIIALCPNDTFEVIGRRTLDDTAWVQVRVTKAGPNGSCTRILGAPTPGTEGWLIDAEVKAP